MADSKNMSFRMKVNTPEILKQLARNNLSFGLPILCISGYMKKIAERALDLNDPELIELLKDSGIVSEDNEPQEVKTI